MSATRINDSSKNAGPQNQPQARAMYARKLRDGTGAAAALSTGAAAGSSAEAAAPSSANRLAEFPNAGQIDAAVNANSRKRRDLRPPYLAGDAETLRISKNLRDVLKGTNVSSEKCQQVENRKCSDFKASRHSSQSGTRYEKSGFVKSYWFAVVFGIVLACFVHGLFGYFVDSFSMASSERSRCPAGAHSATR